MVSYFYAVSYNLGIYFILMLRLSKVWQLKTLSGCSLCFWLVPIIVWVVPSFFVIQDVLGLFSLFPNPARRQPLFSRSAVRLVFRSQALGAGCACCSSCCLSAGNPLQVTPRGDAWHTLLGLWQPTSGCPSVCVPSSSYSGVTRVSLLPPPPLWTSFSLFGALTCLGKLPTPHSLPGDMFLNLDSETPG